MSQLSSNASSVQTLAGDTSANIQETGVNQRFKEEMKLKKAQLALEQAKLGVEKYGIDSSRAGYAGLNASNEKIAAGNNQTQMAVAQQRQALDEKQFAAQQQEWEIRRRMDDRAMQMEMDARKANQEIEEAMETGNLERLEKMKGVREEYTKAMTAAQLAQIGAQADDATLTQRIPEMMAHTNEMLGHLDEGEKVGREAVSLGSLNLGRLIARGEVKPWKAMQAGQEGPGLLDALNPMDDSAKLDLGGVGNVALNLVSGGELGKPMGAAVFKDGPELAKDLVNGIIDGSMEHIVDDVGQVGPAAAQMKVLYSAIMDRAALGSANRVGPPNPMADGAVKEALYKLYQIPGVNKGAVLGFMSGIQAKFLDVQKAVSQNNLELLADPELKKAMAPFVKDQGSRDALLKASKVLGNHLHGMKTAVGEHNIMSAKAVKDYRDLVEKMVTARLGPEKAAELMAKSGFDPSLYKDVKDRLGVDEYLNVLLSKKGHDEDFSKQQLLAEQLKGRYDIDSQIQALGTSRITSGIKKKALAKMSSRPLPTRESELAETAPDDEASE